VGLNDRKQNIVVFLHHQTPIQIAVGFKVGGRSFDVGKHHRNYPAKLLLHILIHLLSVAQHLFDTFFGGLLLIAHCYIAPCLNKSLLTEKDNDMLQGYSTSCVIEITRQ